MSVVLEEADESAFWLELLGEICVLPSDKLKPLLGETNELAAIFGASLRTSKNSVNQ